MHSVPSQFSAIPRLQSHPLTSAQLIAPPPYPSHLCGWTVEMPLHQVHHSPFLKPHSQTLPALLTGVSLRSAATPHTAPPPGSTLTTCTQLQPSHWPHSYYLALPSALPFTADNSWSFCVMPKYQIFLGFGRGKHWGDGRPEEQDCRAFRFIYLLLILLRTLAGEVWGGSRAAQMG